MATGHPWIRAAAPATLARVVWVGAALVGGPGIAGCGPAPATHRAAPSDDAAPRDPARGQRAAREDALRRARFDLAVLARDLGEDRPRPDRSRRAAARTTCPDAVLRESGGDPTLILVARDDRPERRQLLSLALRDEVAEDVLSPIRSALRADVSGLTDGEPASPTDAEVQRAGARLAALRGRPFLAEIRVTAFAPPQITRRIGAMHSEWVPGVLTADLVVHDRRDDRWVCQAPLLVRSHVAEAPIALRSRPATRERLVRELGQELHAAAATALAAMSAFLRWPTPAATPTRARASG